MLLPEFNVHCRNPSLNVRFQSVMFPKANEPMSPSVVIVPVTLPVPTCTAAEVPQARSHRRRILRLMILSIVTGCISIAATRPGIRSGS
jgi:hypothetical protein